MPDVLRIKRRVAGGAATPPASLASSEIVFNEQSRILYYGLDNAGGTTTNIIPIGGTGAFLPLATGGTVSGNVKISVADAALGLLVNGATKGVRFVASASGFSIEGVDNTGVGSYQPLTLFGSALNFGAPATFTSTVAHNTGVNFGSLVAPGGVADLSRHLALYGSTYGFNVTGNRLNHVAAAGAANMFTVGATDIAGIGIAGLTMYGATDVTLARDPQQASHAVWRSYLDANYSTNTQGNARWLPLATGGAVLGYTSFSVGLKVGTPTSGQVSIAVDGASTAGSGFSFFSGGSQRWLFAMDHFPEVGGAAGSGGVGFALYAYNNDGSYHGQALAIARDTFRIVATETMQVGRDPAANMEVVTLQYLNANTVTIAAGDTRWINVTGDAMSGGLGFGNASLSSAVDLTRHINLYEGGASNRFGFNVSFDGTRAHLNYVVTETTHTDHTFMVGANAIASIGPSGVTVTGANASLSVDPGLATPATLAAGTVLARHVSAHGTGFGLNLYQPDINIGSFSYRESLGGAWGVRMDPSTGVLNFWSAPSGTANTAASLTLSQTFNLDGSVTLGHDPVGVMDAVTVQYLNSRLPTGGPFLPTGGGQMTGGINWASNLPPGTHNDLSKHLMLHPNGYGLSVSSDSRLNYNVEASGVHAFVVGGTDKVGITSALTSVNNTFQANSWLVAAYNAAVTPAAGGSGIITWNRSQGAGEVNFYNTYINASGNVFDFRQVTGSGTEKTIASLQSAGTLTLPGNGVVYNGVSGGGSSIGFAWNGSAIVGFINGASGGNLASQTWVGTNYAPITGSTTYLFKAGDSMSGQLMINYTATDTTGQLWLRPIYSGTGADQSRLRFGGTFFNIADHGTRYVTSIRSGMTNAWGTEFLDVWINNTTNDANSDANQTQVARFTLGGLTLGGALTVAGAATVNGALAVPNSGLSLGSHVAAGGATDLTSHIRLYANSYGFSITSSTLNMVAGGTIAFYPAGALVANLTNNGLAFQGTTATVTLGRDPAAGSGGAMEAATRQYVDGKVTGAVVVSSVAALRALNSAALYIFVTGYYADGDGGGGDYVRGVTATDNGGSIITNQNNAFSYYLQTQGQPVSVKQFGARGNNSADDQSAINNAFASGTSFIIPAGTYLASLPLNIVNDGTHVTGVGRNSTRIVATNTSSAAIAIATNATSVTIEHLTVDRSVTAVAGGDGISAPVYAQFCRLSNLIVQHQWKGLRLGPTGYSYIENVISIFNRDDGFYWTNTASNGALQWSLTNCLSTQNGSHGYYIAASSGPGAVALGEILNCSTYANVGPGFAASGVPSCPINGIRMTGGLFGQDGNSEIFLDTYGGDHKFVGVYAELAGTSPTGPTLGTPASNAGSGFEFGINNTDVLCNDCHSEGNSNAGFISATAEAQFSGCKAINNGASTASGRVGFYQTAGRVSFFNVRAGNIRGANSQQYGIYLTNAAGGALIWGADLTGNSTATLTVAAGVNGLTIGGMVPAGNLLMPGGGIVVGTGGAIVGGINVATGVYLNSNPFNNP